MDRGAIDVGRTKLASVIAKALDLPGAIVGDGTELDKYRLSSEPGLLRDVAVLLASQLPADVEVLAGMAIGGVPLAVALALQTGLPWVLVRRVEDARTSGIAGGAVAGRRIVLVKDMARTGAAIQQAALRLRQAGGTVSHAAIGVAWHPDLAQVLAPAGLSPITAIAVTDLRKIW